MDVKEEIIYRSKALFMKYGIRSVTMDDIAREMGISKKTLYQHFNTKDGLLKTAITRHFEEEKEQTEIICNSATDALDEMRQMGTFILSMIEDVSASTLFDLQKYYRRSWESFTEQQNNQVLSCIVSNLQRGMEEGLYRQDLDTEIVARLYCKASYMLVDEMSDASSNFSRRQLIREFYDYHVRGIATPKGLELWNKYQKDFIVLT